LDGNIDGLVHLSDLSWDLPGEEAVKQFNKGDEVEAVVVSIDVERERIALSIKQLNGDPLAEYLAAHKKGDIVKGTVTEVDARQATIEIADGVEASLRVAEWSRERTDDLTNEVKVGDQVDAVIISMDSKNRTINLSVKQMELKQEREALQNVQQQSVDSAGPTTIGDLIKQQMNKK
jgi:small subunit ribosomal protein S1